MFSYVFICFHMFSKACTFKNLSQGQDFGPIELERLAKKPLRRGTLPDQEALFIHGKSVLIDRLKPFFFV